MVHFRTSQSTIRPWGCGACGREEKSRFVRDILAVEMAGNQGGEGRAKDEAGGGGIWGRRNG